jgi:hypothetical protein
MTMRIAMSIVLKGLGLCSFAIAISAVGIAVYELATIPPSQYKDSPLSIPVLDVPIFCGLILFGLGQRVGSAPPPDDLGDDD